MLNHVTLMGRLTAVPELMHTASGTAYCHVCIAVERDYKPQNGEKETDFIEVTTWNGTAEYLSRYAEKGQLVAITGRLQSRKWTDKSGSNHTSWEVQADSAYLTPSAGATATNEA